MASRHHLSIFAQRLDRALFVAYLLGGVVPLAALAYFFAWPALDAATDPAGGGLAQARFLARLGVLVSSGTLCLGSFFVLQRFARQTLARQDASQARLARLVEVSERVADAPHAGEVARRVADAAQAVTEARAALVFLTGSKDTPIELVDHAGEGAAEIYAHAQRAIDAMVALAVEGGRTTLVGDDGGRSATAGLTAGAAVPLRARDGTRGALVAVHVDRGCSFEASHASALATLAGLAAVAVHNADLRDAQRNFFAHATDLVVTALDAFLDYHPGHSRRVAQLANLMGRRVGLDEARLQRLHFASLLHDVGMLKIDRDHWGLPAANRKHPVHGARMIERIRLWEDIAPFVLHHHEWWNGEGYPEKLAGEAIPLEARIIGIAEAFDSMTTAGYRGKMDVEEALRRIEAGAGTQFDPELAAAFLALGAEGAVRVPSE
jgi:HD-GYP domain-containing protein (c-di-GMP phosphodiesterase class II)